MGGEGEADFQSPLRYTPGDDPRFIYHNIAVGIDPGRMLFNGAPGLLATAIDALALQPGQRVLHIGAGTGYYTALIAHTVGSGGRVAGIEVDAELAAEAAANVSDTPWVDMRHGNGAEPLDATFDAILVNAGVTHPQRSWLDALAPGGRIMLPLTATMAVPGAAHPAGAAMANIGKGLLILATRTDDPLVFSARVVTFVAIYSALGLRDDAINAELGRAMAKMPFPPVRRLRLDAHEPDASCWLHSSHACWSTAT